jgi:hypothetical protein
MKEFKTKPSSDESGAFARSSADAVQLKDNRPQSVLQKKTVDALAGNHAGQQVIQQKNNHTGLPDQLKSGVENLSGISMDDVKVHYNSPQPAQLNAHAYAQGTDIHIATGQEKHLPHEAWHVVQQKQGRVKPTLQMKGKVTINDDAGLEKEADVMGSKAAQLQVVDKTGLNKSRGNSIINHGSTNRSGVIQGMFYEWNPDGETEDKKHIWHYGHVIGALWEKKMADDRQVSYNGYGVWLRKGTQAHLSQLLQANEHVASVMSNVRAGYQQITDRIGSREHVVDELQMLREATKRYVTELGLALKTYAGTTVIGVPLLVGAAAVAQHFLSLPGVPIGIKAAIDIAGVLYGGFVTYRWMKSDILPVWARIGLAGGNTAIWATTIYGLTQEALNGQMFNSVHIAALPLAITIEIVLRKIMKKVETMVAENPV